MVDVLMIPGFTGSGPQHWQSLWQSHFPGCLRVEQEDWDHPSFDPWMERIYRTMAAATSEVVVVGHSLGSIAAVHLVRMFPAHQVKGALLVAPADVEAPTAPPECRGFAPIPLVKLPFPSQVVCARDDPFLEPERAKQFAEAWGSDLILKSCGGHLNTDSGHGAWPEGVCHLRELISSL